MIKVEEFREATGYKIPVSVKLGAGRVRDDIKIALKDGFDFVELDGLQGSTGAAGNEVLGVRRHPDPLGDPGGARRARRDRLRRPAGDHPDGRGQGRHRRRQGAGAGCQRGRHRHQRDHRRRLHRLHAVSCRQLRGRHRDPRSRAREALQHRRSRPTTSTAIWRPCAGSWRRIAAAHGYDDFRQFSRDDLAALTPEAAAITGLPYMPELRERSLSPALKVA